MRRSTLPYILPLLALLGCHPVIGFDVSQQAQTTVPGSPFSGLITTTLGLGTMNFSQQSVFQSNGTDVSHVQSARLSRITLTVTSPSTGTLGFLNSIDLFVEVPNQLPKVKVAHLNPVPKQASADLVIDDVDLAPYVKAGQLTVTTTVQGNAPQQNTDVRADLTVHISASVL